MTTAHTNLFYRFGVALVIGILVGLQREYAYGDPEREMFAGVRTFALMALVSRVAAMVADDLASKAAQTYLGDTGVYLSSVVAGLADVDAVTLSMAKLGDTAGGVSLDLTARAIVLAAMSNTFTKSGIVLTSSSASLRLALLPGFVLMLIVGVGVAFLVI